MGTQMKKMAVCIVMMVFCFGKVTSAECLENNMKSVVQVVLTYSTQDGDTYRLQSGSGIVINNNTVLTNYHVVHMTDSNMEKAKKYIAKKGSEADLSKADGICISIVKQDDVLISASIEQESKENDFAVLTLEEETDRPPAVLSKSSEMVIAQSVLAVGYPTTNPFTKKGMAFFNQTDVNLVGGTVSEIGNRVNRISGVLSAGNSGGALLDANSGEVIGLLVYNKKDAKKECFRAIPIDFIKHPYLEGVTYTENTVDESVNQEVVSEEVALSSESTEETVDKEALKECIQRAANLEPSAYTNETYNNMLTWLTQAQEVRSRDNVSQEEVDFARENLQKSMGNLETVKQINWIVVVCIIVAVLVVIALIVVMVIMLVRKSKNKKESEKFVVLSRDDIPNFDNPSQGYQGGSTSSAQLNNPHDTQNATTLLNMAGMDSDSGAGNATTVLNVASIPQVRAFLIRKKNGDSRYVEGIEFTVGKDKAKVNLCINDNDAISRCHMKVVKRGINYYAVDLGSTNHTYLNGDYIAPQEEHLLQSGDVIMLADEEFLFEVK
ncbi:MAG: trypsin-like peptidase domain-containing protein [Lachnospiraceae bacterium]|nr:trypsin-like peptidase domain-containing protein [Lachnospiraceae bacterium]